MPSNTCIYDGNFCENKHNSMRRARDLAKCQGQHNIAFTCDALYDECPFAGFERAQCARYTQYVLSRKNRTI